MKPPNSKTREPMPSHANTTDISAAMAKSKKFQMIKKLKQEKEKKKEVIIRDLNKAKILEKDKKKTQPKKQNEDLMFEEEDIGGGDQAMAIDDEPPVEPVVVEPT